MDLQELIIIFRDNKKIFFGIVASSFFIAILFFLFQAQTYRTTLTLNIARDGSGIVAQEYEYNDFYRLQADERFADTVVRWLESPRIISDIYTNADIATQSWSLKQYRGALNARRLSSQVIDVSYIVTKPQQGEVLAQNILHRLNQEAATLNAQDDNRAGWFRIQGGVPVITDNVKPFPTIIILGLIIGFFIAFWSVIIVHYSARHSSSNI